MLSVKWWPFCPKKELIFHHLCYSDILFLSCDAVFCVPIILTTKQTKYRIYIYIYISGTTHAKIFSSLISSQPFSFEVLTKTKGVNFHQKTNVDSIIHLVGWSIGCHWCFWHLINVMPYRSSCCIQYQVILNDIFMAPGCMGHIHWVLIVDLVLHLSLLCCILRCITLTQWAWVTHICVSKLAIIGSNNGLSPGQRQVIIWTNAGILLIQTLETNFIKF